MEKKLEVLRGKNEVEQAFGYWFVIDFFIFILLSRESDKCAMHRTSPDSPMTCSCLPSFPLEFCF